MKTIIKILLIGVLALPVFPSASNAQQCDLVALEGCFGECGGDAFFAHLFIAEDVNYALYISNSLCGSEGVFVTITVNNRHIVRIVMAGDTDPINFSAQAGDQVTISVRNWRTNPNIVCIRQGEVNITLCRNF